MVVRDQVIMYMDGAGANRGILMLKKDVAKSDRFGRRVHEQLCK